MASENGNMQVEQPEEDSIQIKDLLTLFLANWKWFILSLIIVLGLGVLYILRTPPVYLRTASLLIKDDSKSTSISSDVANMFSELGVGNTNANVYNEMVTLKSPATLLQTIKKLSLDVNYTIPGTFYARTLYGNTLPIKVTFLNIPDDYSASLKVKLLDGNRVELSHFTYGESEDDDTVVKAKLNQAVQTPAGKVIVTPTTEYTAYMRKGESLSINVHRTNVYSTTEELSLRLGVEMTDEDGTVIDISFKDVCPQRAVDIINTIIDVYKQDWVEERNEVTRATSAFITDRLGVIEQELGQVDADISTYKSENLVPDVQAASQLFLTHTREASNMILQLNNRLAMARYIKSYLGNTANNNRLLPANSGMESQGLEKQIADYNELQMQRNTLVSNSSESNPLVVDLDQSLADMRKAINVSVDNLIVDLGTQIKNVERDEQHTYAQIAANPNQEKYLLAVGREQKVKEALYLFLLQKREENELSRTFSAFNTRLLSPPTGSLKPVAPKKMQILLISFVIGMLIPAILLFVRMQMNTTVRGRKDIEKLTIPIIGEIPKFGGRKHRKNLGRHIDKGGESQIVVKAGNRNYINEAFRVLRTNIEFMTHNSAQSCNVIGITSFNAGSGKSTISINIAIALALKGKRVLLIDGDLRRHSVSAHLPKTNKGLADFLNGAVSDMDELPVTYNEKYSSFRIIPVGTIPPNPSELIDQPAMRELIDYMRERYDYIFVDCPPIDIVADTQLLSPMFDRTIFILRAGIFERSLLPELEKMYRTDRFKNLTLVLNGTEVSNHRYGGKGYSYGYGYGRKGGYGYYASYGGGNDD